MLPAPIIPTIALLISLPLIFLIAPRILLLRDLQLSLSLSPDERDDVALFHKAILASSHHHHHRHRPSMSHLVTTTNPKPKIAFLFLTNSDLTFAPLWEKFFHGHAHLYNIYIHADPTVQITPPGGVFQNRFIPAKKTERASPTLISAARRLLANAILDDPLNLYFALVSQHCVPLHSFPFAYKTLFGSELSAIRDFPAQSNHKSFIEIVDDDTNLPERYVARGDDVMLPEVPYERFRVGSQFYILARRHALLVIQDKRLWRKFKMPCLNVYSCYPEEHYFPTLLSMKDPEGCTHYTLTRVNWTDSTDGHPYTYGPGEVSAQLVHTLRDSNSSYSYLFARKFSPECLRPLMELAGRVIFRD